MTADHARPQSGRPAHVCAGDRTGQFFAAAERGGITQPAVSLQVRQLERRFGLKLVERVGRRDNFFELGGHSMLVAQLVGRMKATFDVDLPLAVLFEVSTIAGLAEKVDQARGGVAGTALNLAADAQLADDIRPLAKLPPVEFGEVFLTGATGFVGSQILATLLRDTNARIFSLLRAMSAGAARTRLRRALTDRQLIGCGKRTASRSWSATWPSRISASTPRASPSSATSATPSSIAARWSTSCSPTPRRSRPMSRPCAR